MPDANIQNQKEQRNRDSRDSPMVNGLPNKKNGLPNKTASTQYIGPASIPIRHASTRRANHGTQKLEKTSQLPYCAAYTTMQTSYRTTYVTMPVHASAYNAHSAQSILSALNTTQHTHGSTRTRTCARSRACTCKQEKGTGGKFVLIAGLDLFAESLEDMCIGMCIDTCMDI